MNEIEKDQCLEEIEELENKKWPQEIEENEILEWVTKSSGVFQRIGMDSSLVKSFIESFKEEKYMTEITLLQRIKESLIYSQHMDSMSRELPDERKEKKEQVWSSKIGPFKKGFEVEKCQLDHGYNKEYRCLDSVLIDKNYSLWESGSMSYAKIFFNIAKEIIKKAEEEKRLVPMWLIKEIKTIQDDIKIENIASLLSDIEKSYQKKNPEDIMLKALDLLDKLLDFDEDLDNKRNIKSKLVFLLKKENKKKLKDFGVSLDLVEVLNQSRVIRNAKVSHNDFPKNYHFPMVYASTFAYSVIFFLESMILSGYFKNK